MPWLWGKQGCCDNVLAVTSFDNVIGWPLTPNREDLMEMEVAPHGNDDVRGTNWGSTGTPPWQRDHQPPPEPVSRALCLFIARPTIHHYHCHYCYDECNYYCHYCYSRHECSYTTTVITSTASTAMTTGTTVSTTTATTTTATTY